MDHYNGISGEIVLGVPGSGPMLRLYYGAIFSRIVIKYVWKYHDHLRINGGPLVLVDNHWFRHFAMRSRE